MMIIEEADGTLRCNGYCYDCKLENECHKSSIQYPDCGEYMDTYCVFKEGEADMYYYDDLMEALIDSVEKLAYNSSFSYFFNEARFDITEMFDSCIVVACMLPNGYVLTESVVEGDSLEDDVIVCVHKLLMKASTYGEFAMFNEFMGEDDSLINDMDCENCEYFHECCGDDEFI